jgi:hypothetical protein
MKGIGRGLFLGLLGLLTLMIAHPGAHAQCVSGTSTAELITTGPHAGLYKYTIDITWSTPQGLSNVTMDCGFGACPEESCTKIFEFDTPAGHSDGEPSGCLVDYAGEFNCSGNPSIGYTDPIIKWDALDMGGCEPGPTGSATLCFYTELGPFPATQSPVFLIKDGQNVCQGMIAGDCPAAPCAVPVQESNWGAIKALYN